jgi:CheY-like chemotaxis protein
MASSKKSNDESRLLEQKADDAAAGASDATSQETASDNEQTERGVEGQGAPSEDDAADAAASAEDGPPASPVVPLAVLLVERDESTVAAVRAALPEGYELVEAHDGDEGFELARKWAPDLIIVDPAVAGEALARRLGADPLATNTPFILLFAPGDDDEREGGEWPGTVARLTKPFEPDELRQQLRAAVEGVGPAQPLLRNNLGVLTVAEVVDLVQREIEQWVLEAGGPDTAKTSVKLDEISDVVGALWTFIAKLRDAVSKGSEGRVLFGPLDEGRLGILNLTGGVGESEPVPEEPIQDVDIISEVPEEQMLESLAGMRVVVADDEPDVRALLEDVLGLAGMEVEAVANGAQALEAIRRERPDVVVTDVVMPEMDGWELLRLVRRDLVFRDLPVVVLSSKVDFLRALRSHRDGAQPGDERDQDYAFILLGIAQVLAPHRQILQRLETFEQISGRVESTGIVPLLLAVADVGGRRRLVVREAGHTCRADFRDGRLVAVQYNAASGREATGVAALRSMLGISAGRYGVEPLADEAEVALEGDLDDLLSEATEPVHRLVEMVTGAAMLRIRDVLFHDNMLEDFLVGADAQVRDIVEFLQQGRAPKDLLLNRVCRTPDLERVLLELVRRGAVEKVVADQPSIPPPMQVHKPRADGPRQSSAVAPPPSATPSKQPGEVLTGALWEMAVSRRRVFLYLALVGGVAFALTRWGSESDGGAFSGDSASASGLHGGAVVEPRVGPWDGGSGMYRGGSLNDGALDGHEWADGASAVARVPEVRIVVDGPGPDGAVGVSPPSDSFAEETPPSDGGVGVGDARAHDSSFATASDAGGDGGGEPDRANRAALGDGGAAEELGSGQESQYGTLEITAPPGPAGEVTVVVDGQPRGTAPLTLSLLPGVHQIIYQTGGQRSYAAVRIVAGATTKRRPRVPSSR